MNEEIKRGKRSTRNGLSRRAFLHHAVVAGVGVSLTGRMRPTILQQGESLTAKINKSLDEFMTQSQAVGLVVGVIQLDKNKKPQTQTFFRGETKLNNGTLPDEKTIFELGSITKIFTATLLADMVFNQKLLALEDVVQTYYDKLAPGTVTLPSYKGQKIKFVDLATHTAGFPDDPPNLKDGGLCKYTPQLMYTALQALTLPQAPGDIANYSNLGFGTLADCLCLISGGQPYETVIRALLDKAKLKMPDTHIIDDQFSDPHLAQGYTQNATTQKRVEAAYCMPTWPAFNGAGGLRSTLSDMLEWASFNLGLTTSPLNTLLPELTKPRHDFGKVEKIGLGWQLRPMKILPKMVAVTKNGGTLGFTTDITFVKETSTAVVSLTNMAGTDPTALNAHLIELLNGGA